jgi:hypothetical protein
MLIRKSKRIRSDIDLRKNERISTTKVDEDTKMVENSFN